MKSIECLEVIKRGRRMHGKIWKLLDGRKVYVAYRKTFQIYRSKELNISAAMRSKTAAWAIDSNVLREVKRKGCELISIWDKKSDTKYITSIEDFFDRNKILKINYSDRGGSNQKCLPLGYFRVRKGLIKI